MCATCSASTCWCKGRRPPEFALYPLRGFALPLTCLPASSPRIVTGRGTPSSTISPFSIVARRPPRLRSAPSPRHYTGRSARQGDEGQRRPCELDLTPPTAVARTACLRPAALGDRTANGRYLGRVREDLRAFGGAGRQRRGEGQGNTDRGPKRHSKNTRRPFKQRSHCRCPQAAVGLGMRGRFSARNRQSSRSLSPSWRLPKNWMIILPSAP